MSNNEEFDQLCTSFLEAKAKKAAIELIMATIGDQLLEMVEKKQTGVSKRNSNRFTLEVQFKQNLKIPDVGSLRDAVSDDVFEAVTRVKYEVDARAMKKFDANPNVGPALRRLIEVRDEKPWVKVEPVTA